MAHELVYTSAERGLRPGTRGFCTVAHTRGMAPATMRMLESLSAYRSLYGAQEAATIAEPVAWSHYRVSLMGRSQNVLSRVSPIGVDHTNRSNKLAHHLLITSQERPVGGPLWLCAQPGVFLEEWNEEPHVIDQPKVLPSGDEESYIASSWASLTGDAGHAGTLASLFHARDDMIVVLVYEAGVEMAPLLREAMALLAPDERWLVTYNTYFTSLPAGMSCAWRCCVVDSDACREAKRNPKATVIDLTGTLPEPDGNDSYVKRAREGGAPIVVKAPETQGKSKFKLMQNREINQLNLKPRKL